MDSALGKMAFSHVDVMFIGAWLSVYLCSKLATNVWVRSSRCSLSKKQLDSFAVGAPSYVMSMINAVIMCLRGVDHTIALWNVSGPERMQPTPVPGMPWGDAVLQVHATNAMFKNYLIVDAIIVLWNWPKLGKFDVVAHHLAFLLVSFIGGATTTILFQFALLSLTEVSTLFLNTRWFLIKLDHGASKAMTVVNLLFALSFFLARVLVYGYGLYDLFFYSKYLTRPGPIGKSAILTLIALGFCLNMFWFKKILNIAMSTSQPQAKEKTKSSE